MIMHKYDLISVLKMRLSEYTELNWTVTNRVFITIKGRGICTEWFFIDFEVGETSVVVKYLHVAYSHRIDLYFFNTTVDIEVDAVAEYAN